MQISEIKRLKTFQNKKTGSVVRVIRIEREPKMSRKQDRIRVIDVIGGKSIPCTARFLTADTIRRHYNPV